MGERPSASLGERFRRRFRRTRPLPDLEWTMRFDPARAEIEILFFAPRVPTGFELRQHDDPLRIVAVECGPRDGTEPMDYTLRESVGEDGKVTIRCVPIAPCATKRVILRFDGSPETGEVVKVCSLDRREHDLALVESAHEAASREQWAEAVEPLLRYTREYSPDNAAVCYWIADWSRKLHRMDVAEEFAARAAGNGNPEPCDALYRSIREEQPVLDGEALRSLRGEAAAWSIGPQHGIVVLERDQRHLLGLDGFELRKVRETLEVRRPAAARMLNQLEFGFSDRDERPLFTRLTVHHEDGQVEKVPLEHFTVSDHQANNVFITMENEKAGHWILPDLARGDVIEWEYDLIHRNRRVDDEPQTFSLSSTFDSAFPTFRARHQFVSPESLPVRFSVRNGELETTREVDDSRVVHAFSGREFIPAKHTGFDYENEWLNPLVVCSTEGPDWTHVAGSARKSNFGSAPIEEDPPPPIAELLDGVPAEEALGRAFYWIRDRLRYASMRSGLVHIGSRERGRRIVEAGVGDCKDKSYLLALVCRRLGIPCEFVCVSTKTGVLVEDMPADQFDHVFVRARIADEWLYLDAANRFATFGSPPAWCQGLGALVLGDPVSLLEIPVDPPYANRLEIREVFDRFLDGHVAGRFEVSAEGQMARLADEFWKASSLAMTDPRQAGQRQMNQYLPGAIVHDYRRGAETSGSSRFHVEGNHTRGPLTVLGRRGQALLPIAWDVPALPIPEWRILRLDRIFSALLVMTAGVTLRLEGDVRRAVDDISRIPDLDNPVVGVTEEIAEDSGAVEIRREVTARRKIVLGEETAHVPPGLEHVERALRMVIACDAAAVSSR